MKKMNIITMAVGAVLLASCSDTIEMRRPPVYELPEQKDAALKELEAK